jgi:hypothetical protein
MKHEREFDTNYFHNPIVQGVNYPLFIMLLKEMVSMESKGQLGAVPAASPLISSPSSDQNCVFHVSPLTPRQVARGVLYIAGFRSRRICGDQDCIERTHEGEVGPTMQPDF